MSCLNSILFIYNSLLANNWGCSTIKTFFHAQLEALFLPMCHQVVCMPQGHQVQWYKSSGTGMFCSLKGDGNKTSRSCLCQNICQLELNKMTKNQCDIIQLIINSASCPVITYWFFIILEKYHHSCWKINFQCDCAYWNFSLGLHGIVAVYCLILFHFQTLVWTSSCENPCLGLQLSVLVTCANLLRKTWLGITFQVKGQGHLPSQKSRLLLLRISTLFPFFFVPDKHTSDFQ